METTKICSKCNQKKEISDFYIFKHTGKYHKRCKICDGYIEKERYKNNKEEISKRKKENYLKIKDRINEKRRIYYINHKDELAKKNKTYRDKNKKILLEKKKIYYIENKIKLQTKHKEYNIKNRDKLKLYFSEYRKTDKRQVQLKNSSHKRRVVKQNGNVTTEQILELQNNSKKCYWCGCSLKGIKTHLDHYIPISKGGEHTINNLVISCSKCNLVKGSKDPICFANSIGKLF